jgi:hypothetical protein
MRLTSLSTNSPAPRHKTVLSLPPHAQTVSSDPMESWLKQSGASGLDGLELADFSDTGRGVRTLRRFKEGEKILTIPCGVLWTVEHAYADPFLGPALLSTRPPLSVDDTLAMYILFVRSCGSGYDGLRSHVAALPTSYTSSIFFAEAELEVCAGTSLYTTTKQLDRQIEDDYRGLVVRLFGRHQELFPRDKFTIEDVGITTRERCCESATDTYFPSYSTSGLSAPCGVVRWILSCPMEIRFDFWRPSRTC